MSSTGTLSRVNNTEVVDGIPNLRLCKYIFVRGQRKGQECKRRTFNGTDYCCVCIKKKSVIKLFESCGITIPSNKPRRRSDKVLRPASSIPNLNSLPVRDSNGMWNFEPINPIYNQPIPVRNQFGHWNRDTDTNVPLDAMVRLPNGEWTQRIFTNII